MSIDRSAALIASDRDTRAEVTLLLDQGVPRGQIGVLLGISKSTVAYHARRRGVPGLPAGRRRYDWAVVQAYYDAGHSVAECQEHFGFARAAWSNAVKRGAVRSRPRATPLRDLLDGDVPRGRWNIKRRLIAAGLKRNTCEECGLEEWRGRELSLDLHHINGVRHDNRLENLALLCPNCHSQTDNFGILNRRRAE